MAPPENTDKDSLSLYDNALLSDVQIKFSGQTFYGHKAILCQRSKYFMKAFTGGFEEAYTGEIDLGTDDDPDCIRNMLRHIYDLPHDVVRPSDKLAGEYVDLFLVSDKYDVPSLRSLCTTHVRCHLSYADITSTSFSGALQKCFSSVQADDSMRKTMIERIMPHMRPIMKQPGFVDVLKKAPDLAVPLLVATLDIGMS